MIVAWPSRDVSSIIPKDVVSLIANAVTNGNTAVVKATGSSVPGSATLTLVIVSLRTAVPSLAHVEVFQPVLWMMTSFDSPSTVALKSLINKE